MLLISKGKMVMGVWGAIKEGMPGLRMLLNYNSQYPPLWPMRIVSVVQQQLEATLHLSPHTAGLVRIS